MYGQYFSYHAMSEASGHPIPSFQGLSQQMIIGGTVLREAAQMTGFPKEICDTVLTGLLCLSK